MIEVAIRRADPTRFGRYRTVATIRVQDDGTYTTTSDGDEAGQLLTIPILRRGEGGTAHQLRIDDDPEAWVRLLHTALRTGYLLVDTIVDTRLGEAPAVDQLAAQLRTARRRRQFSQVDLAAKLDVDPSYISQLEAGRGNVTLGQLDRIAAALDEPVTITIGAPEGA